MRFGKVALLLVALAVALVSGWSSPGEAVTLSTCDNNICAFDGDFAVMSLPFAGVDVQSPPGIISGGIVVYTGSNGKPVTTNFAGMDNAYPSVTGSVDTSFSTTTTADPGQVAPFTGDAAASWDSTLSAFITFLGSSSPIFFFNQNDNNSNDEDGSCPGADSGQDVCVYAALTLVDLDDPTNNRTFELEGPTVPFTSGPQGTGEGVFNPLTDWVLAKGDVCLDANGDQTPCDGSGNPVVFGPENHNLGQDHASYAAFSDVLNALLATCASDPNSVACPWDSLSIRLDLTDLNNGYEQLFILTAEQVSQIPEPGTLILLGAGLVGLGASAWRRRQRG